MLKFIKGFFITLGIIFFLLIIVIAYLIIADPFEIRPLIKSFQGDLSVVEESMDQTSMKNIDDSVVVDKNPLLNTSQEKTLEALGIDPATIPTTFTPDMEVCAVEKLGAQRVEEIKGGATPTVMDYMKGKDCL